MCDYVLQFICQKLHIVGTQKSTADSPSRIDLNPKERVELKRREDITIRPIQRNLQSSDVADEEQLAFFSEKTIETEEEILLQKEHAKQRTKENQIDNQRNRRNLNKQSLVHLRGNKGKGQNQSRTSCRACVKSNQGKTVV